MKLITQLFFFFSLKNENHERQNFIHWWSLKILWVSYTMYIIHIVVPWLSRILNKMDIHSIKECLVASLGRKKMTNVENWFLCSHKMAISFSLHPISPEKWRPCFSQALTDEILFVIYADCRWCLFQEIKQASLLPISVIKHLHMLLKHTLAQRNVGQQI